MLKQTKKTVRRLMGCAAVALPLIMQPTMASASEPFVGEIRMFAGNFAPRGWALADGQLLAVSQNDALFSLFGTIYGGDGRTTFGLPGLRGRVAIGQGTGPGLSTRRLGARGGAETVTLTVADLPSHSHDFTATTTATLHASSLNGDQNAALGNSIAPGHARVNDFSSAAPDVEMHPGSILITGNPMPQAASANSGGSRSHNNMMPYQALNQIVSLIGVYPSRQ